MNLETCQSGLMCLFAKEVSPLSGSGGSNPPVSALCDKLIERWVLSFNYWVTEVFQILQKQDRVNDLENLLIDF